MKKCVLLAALLAPAASFAPAGGGRQCGVARPRPPSARPIWLQIDVGETEEPEVRSDPPAPPAAPDGARDENFFAPRSEMELAEQEAKLTALSEKWKRREEQIEYQDTIRSGFGPAPERINGRTAMFFIVTGLVTEYYTGQSLPQQVYTMLQTLSIVE